jgi:uncharacterized protein (DUF736 family)
MPRIGSLRPTPHGGFAGSLHLVDVIVDIALEPRTPPPCDGDGPHWDVTDATGVVIGSAELDDHGDLGLVMTMPLLDCNPVRCVARRDDNDPSGERLDLIWLIAPAQTSPDHARRFS